jgi:hypothetical protein
MPFDHHCDLAHQHRRPAFSPGLASELDRLVPCRILRKAGALERLSVCEIFSSSHHCRRSFRFQVRRGARRLKISPYYWCICLILGDQAWCRARQLHHYNIFPVYCEHDRALPWRRQASSFPPFHLQCQPPSSPRAIFCHG